MQEKTAHGGGQGWEVREMKYILAFLLGIIPGFGFPKAMHFFVDEDDAAGIVVIAITVLLELMVVLCAFF